MTITKRKKIVSLYQLAINMNINSSKKAINKSAKNNDNASSNSLSDILSIKIDDKNFMILRKSDSKTEGERLDIKIVDNIPILFLKWRSQNLWWYHPTLNIIIMYENSDDETLRHELIHSIEFKKEKTEELCSFYEKVKESINEDSFSDSNGFVTFNFTKNIHEFIADWYSKEPFIMAMKKEKLYDKFLEETKYLFE